MQISKIFGVGADDVPDHRPAQWALATTHSAPLLDGAVVAHAHVSAHVQHRVDGILVADGAFGTRIGALLVAQAVLPLVGRIICAIGNGLLIK